MKILPMLPIKPLTPRRIRKYALAFLRGESIPVFAMKADNFSIDREIDAIMAARRKKYKKNRTTGVFYRGGD